MDPEKDRVTTARAELVWRDHEFEREMSATADAREARRQKFDEALAQRQMEHGAAIAKEQLDTAHAAARAAKWAAGAAGVAALGAIGQLVGAIVKWRRGLSGRPDESAKIRNAARRSPHISDEP